MRVHVSMEAPDLEDVRLLVPRRTGSLGDTLIAWGMAILVGEVAGPDVTLAIRPEAFAIEWSGTWNDLEERSGSFDPAEHPGVWLRWLGSTARNRTAPSDVADLAVDRDRLRDDYALVRARGQRPDSSGEAAAAAVDALALKYPLFLPLTNPGKQWAGYNSFVERAKAFWSPAGIAAIFRAYQGAGGDEATLPAAIDAAMRSLGLRTGSDRFRNPPGFLFPGASKGPTMRVDGAGVVTGQTAALDWMLADRGDLSAIELYLAYLGYFAAARVLGAKGSRVVVVPVPGRVDIALALAVIEQVQPRTYPTSPPAQAADVALAYGQAALTYVEEIRGWQASESDDLAFVGAQLAYFWMPSGNTYALDHVSWAEIPRWVGPLYAHDGYDPSPTQETIERHRRQVRGVGRAESGEAREAAFTYRASLGGGVRAWLDMLPVWFRAVIAERYVGSWTVADVERILMAQRPDLQTIVNDEAFRNVTAAIRRVTVAAHYARKARQDGRGRPDGQYEGIALDPQYDLITLLREAASRHPVQFQRELLLFISTYNDEAMRRKASLVRQEDLLQVIRWLDDDRDGLMPALLLAFGVCPLRRETDAVGDVGPAVEGDGGGDEE